MITLTKLKIEITKKSGTKIYSINKHSGTTKSLFKFVEKTIESDILVCYNDYRKEVKNMTKIYYQDMKPKNYTIQYNSKDLELINKIIETEDMQVEVEEWQDAYGNFKITVSGHPEYIDTLKEIHEMVRGY